MKPYSAGGFGGGGAGDISQLYERNHEATIYVGNLDPKVDEDLLCELFTQCGPIKNLHIPRDKITSVHSSYGFVEYENELDADYAIKILNMVKLYGKPIRCNKATHDKRTQEVGANLFIGNLDVEVDEKLLYDTFSSFGQIISAKVMRDPETGGSKGYGFVSYDSFEASDACLVAMNGQFLCNRPIHVSYAYKKDTKGERHGSAAERLIAANRPQDKIKPLPNFSSVASNAIPNLPNMPNLPNFNTGFPNMPSIPPPPMLGAFHGGPIPSPSITAQQPGAGLPNGMMPPTMNTANMLSSMGRGPRQDMPPPNFIPHTNISSPLNMLNSGKSGGEGERGGEGGVGNFPAPPKNLPPPFLGGMPPFPNMGVNRVSPPFGGGGIPGLPPGMPPPMFFPMRPGLGFPPGMPPLPNSNFGGSVPAHPNMQNTRS